MKKRYLLLGLVAVAAGAYYFTPSISSIVSSLVHKYGSEVLGTNVEMKGLDFSLSKGEASIDKITIANPKNYKSPTLFDLTKVQVKVDLKSLASDTIVIDSILIDKPEITYEMLSVTQNNIKQIQDNIQNYLKAHSSQESKAEAKEETTKKEEGSAKKVVIKDLQIKGAKLAAAAMGKEISVTLPDITMKNIGEEKKEKSIPEVIADVMNKILSTASQAVVKNNLSNLEDVAKENLQEVVGNVKDRVKELGIFGN